MRCDGRWIVQSFSRSVPVDKNKGAKNKLMGFHDSVDTEMFRRPINKLVSVSVSILVPYLVGEDAVEGNESQRWGQVVQ